MRIKGFTLIELIAVIVIVSLLAIVAAPRFLNIKNDANMAVMQGHKAAFEAALGLAHANWAVRQGKSMGNNISGYGGNVLDFNDVGYPLGTDKKEVRTQPYNIGMGHKACREIWSAIMDQDIVRASDETGPTDAIYVATRLETTFKTKSGEQITGWSECKYVHTENNDHYLIYDSRTGSVTLM